MNDASLLFGVNVARDDARDDGAVLGRDGHFDPDGAVARRDVELPAHRHHHHAHLPQQPIVGGVARPRRPVEPQGGRAAAIDDVDEGRAVAARYRALQREVRGELDEARGVPRRLVDVRDDGVARVLRVHREPQPANHLFPAGADVGARDHLDFGDFSVRGWNDRGEHARRQGKEHRAKGRTSLHAEDSI